MKPSIPQYELTLPEEPFRLVQEIAIDTARQVEEQRRTELNRQEGENGQLHFDHRPLSPNPSQVPLTKDTPNYA